MNLDAWDKFQLIFLAFQNFESFSFVHPDRPEILEMIKTKVLTTGRLNFVVIITKLIDNLFDNFTFYFNNILLTI
ncbi:hypothetical protein RCL_jg29784.t1 [Rhizophagus clarus]|uniref:Uncharacterized protein n=1 Tax=Rhizophagus clarus TaxID=94130 RepID=A0A8H3LP20_9GLOM|nr:hypothetical protein RCL_jg29784.t1 [Rhizophagus clarus]